RTDTCELADLHLALLPGTDVALFHGILHILFWEDWIDRSFIAEHPEGFADLKELVCDYTPTTVADICGIDRAELPRCAE
ncbi:nitrate reductase, partial [Pseudomonas aeruginosa]